MTDQPPLLSAARPLGALLPGVLSQTTATASSALSTSASSAPPARLSDAELVAVEAVAAAPLPELASCDGQFLAKCLRMLDTLPRRKDDVVGGEVRVRAYELAIGQRPKAAIEFLVTEALRNCRFFPSTSECVEILKRWERRDAAVQEQRQAAISSRHERQARFEDAMTRLAAGEASQDEIDAMPDYWKRVGETRSLLWRCDCGSYVLRPRRGSLQEEVRN